MINQEKLVTYLQAKQIQIPKPSKKAERACRERVDNLTKPIYSLAQLEVIAVRLAGLLHTPKPNHLFMGGVLFMGEKEVPALATKAVLQALQATYQTCLITKEQEEDLSWEDAYELGKAEAIKAKKAGLQIVALGASRIDRESKAFIVMTAFVLELVALGLPVVFDTLLIGQAVEIATRAYPDLKAYAFASIGETAKQKKAQAEQMETLGLMPYLFYDIDRGEGLGAALGLSLIDASLHMLNDMKTFGEASVTVAEDGPGNGRQDGR